MIAIEQKSNRSKLFAAIAVLAMVVCAFAAIVPADDVNGVAMEVTNAPEASDTVAYVSDAAEFTAALNNDAIESIVISVTPAEGATGPTVLDLTGSTVTILEDKKVYIGATTGANGEFNGTTTVTNTTTVQVKFGNLVVEGEVYNLLGANKATSALWVDNLTMSGTGTLFSTSALNASDGVTDRNGFYTSTPHAENTYRQYYSAQLSAIDDYVVANDYSGQGVVNEKAIFSYGETTVTEADNGATLTDIGVYLNPDSTMTVAEDATLAPSKVVVKVDANDETRSATLVNNGTVTLNKGSEIAGTFTNNNAVTVAGTVTGTISNSETGEVTVSAADSGVNIEGGQLTFANMADARANMPNVETGTIVTVAGKAYTANTSTSNDYTFVFGVPAPQYNSNANYAGDPAMDIVVLNIKNLTGTTIEFATAPVIVMEKNIQPGADGKATEAGQYDMMFRVSSSVYDDAGENVTNFSATINGIFTILPMTITNATITGTGEGGAFPPVFYDDGNEVWLQPGDFKVTATINGVDNVELVLDEDYTYICDSADGKWAGTATIIVTLGDNYTTADGKVITKDYTISKNMVDMTVTLTDPDALHYSGEQIDKTDFQFVGNYEDGSKTQTSVGGDYIDPNSTNVTITGSQYYGVPGADGIYVVEFVYDYNGTQIEGRCQVDVIPVDKIEITKNPTKMVYNAGESFDATGMQVTVTYAAQEGEDAGLTAVFNYADGKFTIVDGDGAGTLTGVTLDANIVLDHGIFNETIGTDTVTATYYGKSAELEVTVNGYIATYMVKNPETGVYEEYGTQVGTEADFGAVFNFIGTAPSGQEFTGWMVGTTGAIYQPGDMFKFGEDANMWTSDEITFYAQYGTAGTGGDTGATDPATQIKIFIGSNEGGVDVMLYGVDGYIPAGATVTVTYSYTVYSELLQDYTNTDNTVNVGTVADGNELSTVMMSLSLTGEENYEQIIGAYATITIDGQSINSDLIFYTPATTA